MQNWSVDENYLKKFPKKYEVWKLVQTLTYGLDGQKISKNKVIENWSEIASQLDPNRREFVEFLLWPQQF